MSALSDWLLDTFLYTAALIALVLLARRPVARHCGPQIAYGLWLLPLLRFVMPPVVLPAWMAPAEPVAATPQTMAPALVLISDAPSAAAPVPGPALGIEVGDLLAPLWLAGAVLFLFWRVREYLAMRADLLSEAMPVGESGKVRLVETPAVSAPVAFGVRDRVVALPPAFMAHHDITARDLAIAHELAHHRGHDLVANIAAQPLLALHWFNPLAWWGWRAMRRDQEAACDARVVAGRARSERAVYAEVIAGFAAGRHLALAAPMACPVLGEKSIVHRLRSLTMTDVTTARRRIGIAAIATTAMALPLTASISYAAEEAPTPPEPPLAPGAPSAPRPPEAPPAPVAPTPPLAPQAPDAHDVHGHGHGTVIVEDRNGEHRALTIEGDTPLSQSEVRALQAELRRSMDDAHDDIEQARQDVERALEQAHAEREYALEHAQLARDAAMRAAAQVEFSCEGDQPVVERRLSDGRRAIAICQSAVTAQALAGLHQAREALAADRDISASERREAMREIDAAMREIRSSMRELRGVGQISMRTGSASGPNAVRVAVSYRVAAPTPPLPPQPPRLPVNIVES
ncbi:M56 family metallopeptidase [Aurantiacibacter spongiae]|uniref:Peptidase M56 domain-containing protein n=1 Tax=Aurantiacibacter spongiae TaxID=2488860 RepID=A0A3N5CT53_9SPHN|nr:M56 family metallopeptidase [Aurantiacibacter spongiae]RPF70540.1 hypothetical protein EG799_02070 [Aurantiacibacter spongiae]